MLIQWGNKASHGVKVRILNFNVNGEIETSWSCRPALEDENEKNATDLVLMLQRMLWPKD